MSHKPQKVTSFEDNDDDEGGGGCVVVGGGGCMDATCESQLGTCLYLKGEGRCRCLEPLYMEMRILG